MSGRSGTATSALGANPSAMKRGRGLPYCLLLIALLLGAAILRKDGGAGFPTSKTRSSAQWAHLYAALPLSFEANRGQTDPSVDFLSRGQGYALFLTPSEAVLTLKTSVPASGQKSPASPAALRLQLLGANSHARPAGRDELPGKANYFIGNDPRQWHTNIPTYAKVKYEGVYPGVDLVYYGTQGGELEYDFVVGPGADPQAIALDVAPDLSPPSSTKTGGGKPPLQINAEGDLVVQLPSGNVQLHKPVVYQTRTPANRPSSLDNRQSVAAHYILDAQNHVRFEVGPYDHNRPLVIDPVLIYATYLGGSGGDIGFAIAVDSVFDAYIAGVTNSTNFPAKAGEQSSYRGNGDCFVTKLNTTGTQLLYSTYLGGSQTDTATALAVSNGSVFLTGFTTSADFPIKAPAGTGTPEPFQMNYGGSTDAFVAEIDATGSTLVYSSYLGGSGADFGEGIDADSSGNAYVTGSTQSSDFPIVNAYQPNNNGSQNAFVAEVNPSGEELIYSTYLGGSGADAAQSIQLGGSGNVYLTGYTFSKDFPLLAPLQNKLAGGADAFVTELNITNTGSTLVFSTFLGGSNNDEAYGLALDGSKNVYITGYTISSDFPTTSGAVQPSLKGASNAFVTKLNPAGSSLLYSTYLGGSGNDQGKAIAVTSAGAAFVTGSTNSSDFPTANPIQAILGLSSSITYCQSAPCPDAFVTQINAAGNALTYSTYLGGNGYDAGQAIAVDSAGDPYITGSTSSLNFPAIYNGFYKSTLTGTAGNAFVAKIDSANNANISIVPASVSFGNETISVTSALQQVNIVNPSTAPLSISEILVYPVGTSNTVFTETDNCVGSGGTGTLSPGGGFCTMYVAFTPNSTGSVTSQIVITDNANAVPGTQQTIALTGTGVTAATAVTVQPTSLSFPSQNVGTVSPPQSVTITNTGTQVLNLTSFSTGTGGDFASTNNCGAQQDTLGIGQSCTVSVTFSPTASGTRSGALSISDNATGSPQIVSLTGIGASAFTLSSPAANNPVVIGATSTTFTIEANGPTSFNGAITLACSAGTTCAFSANPIFVGAATSTMTVSNLTTSLPNPYAFQVTGTSGSQTTSLQMNLEFEDYTLTATPSSDTIEAGSAAKYNIIINPLYGFDHAVQLAIETTSPSLPDYTVTFSPTSAPTLNWPTPSQVTMMIQTTRYVAPTAHVMPRPPNGKLPSLIFGLLSLAALVSLGFGNRRRARHGWLGSGWLGVRMATLSLVLALNLALAACRSSTLLQTGTTIGGYTITVSGTLVSNTAVVRTTTLALAVTGTPVT